MGSRPLSLAEVYRQGGLTDLLNPKLLLFFFSFLPQFVDAARSAPSLQMLVLGLLFQALAGGSVAGLLARNPFWARLQRCLSSMMLVGLGSSAVRAPDWTERPAGWLGNVSGGSALASSLPRAATTWFRSFPPQSHEPQAGT
jgi:LysE type translocator